MWYLTSEHDKRIIYVLPGKSVILGRSLDGQNCNFAIPEDPSLSRKHATLFISEGNLLLKDLGSKYGTFINNSVVLEANNNTKLNSDDIIKFGKLSCVWKVQHVNFTTCTSTLKGENLHNLKNILGKVGGCLKNEWDNDCLYLTMPAITLTIKVVLALVQNSHIVTVAYWNKCLESVNENIPLPNPDNFTPQILESTINKEEVSFCPNKERSVLFSGKKIVFFSRRQLELYKNVLTKGSANALLLSESKMTKSALCDNDVIVIQYTITSTSQETQTQKDQIKEIIEYLKSKGKRVVADAEIGLAILYCSTSKYCNPAFNFSSEVIKQVPCHTNNKNILAPESQEPSANLHKNENLLIEESLTAGSNTPFNTTNENLDNGITLKRKFSQQGEVNNELENPNKKLASANTSKLSLSITKKRQNEDNDSENPPKKVALSNNDDEDGIFSFTKTNANKTNDTNINKKLNLSKPMKRKIDADNDEEDLFNFVNKGNKKAAIESSPHTVVEDPAEIVYEITKRVNTVEEKVDISAIRGSKLEDLMKANLNIPSLAKIKKEKEETTDLDERFSNIDLGSTTLVTRNDLIVKKEPIEVKAMDNGLKNFKKFKKIWPVKVQVTIVPKSCAHELDTMDESKEQLVL